jgi:predicted ribosome quality control (RQC) complex YloA/Tae2 family protein
MDDGTIKALVAELEPLLLNRKFGKVFQLGPESFAIDFGLRNEGFLFISVEPALPRAYLIKRRVRDLEKQSIAPTQMALTLKSELSHATLGSLEKDAGERILRFRFKVTTDLGEQYDRVLVAQLTGRAANAILLGAGDVIIAQARPGRGAGQSPGELYRPPPKSQRAASTTERFQLSPLRRGQSLSEALDSYYGELTIKREFAGRAAAARANLRKQISRQQKLLQKLAADDASHANFEEHKKIGDLLLANVSSARRSGNRVKLIDYFAGEGEEVEIEIEIDEKTSLPDEAARRFSLYSRSKRALNEIAKRLELARADLSELKTQESRLEEIIAARNDLALADFISPGGSAPTRAGKKKRSRVPGARQYLSSDGFEILVGRAARDNDHLTFKVARPNDLWLHAADYPGSHVIVRNATRREVPRGTIVEAAQLAAYFSQASKDPKVDVHFTERKFLSKPKGAAPGLVRLSRFKNLTVTPKEAGTRVL